MLVKEVCSSRIVNKCYRQGPLFCRWSVYTSGLRSNHGTARAWQCPSAVVCLDPCRSGELSPWVAISVDGTAPNPWWVSTSDPEMKAALFLVSSRPAGEPNKSGKAQRAAEWPSLELLERKMFWKHYFSVFFFFFFLSPNLHSGLRENNLLNPWDLLGFSTKLQKAHAVPMRYRSSLLLVQSSK